ncbi:hypothetical protein LJR225_003092 [Phenylobacterium sp. LjRoot225]|uniref:hypothetical protein n=1 Tax=Phenylobacterium sp. LjRoot225 TaxID=3342285 RepID=UPI003ECD4CA3
MAEPESLSDPASDPAHAGGAEAARGVMAAQLAMLGRLAEAGLNLALAIEQQATAAQAAAPEAPDAAAERLGALALAYGRVSRAVRLSVALQGRVLKELQALDDVAARTRKGELAEAARTAAAQAAERKGRVERIVGRVIAEAFDDQAEVDRAAEEAWDRLEHDDIYGDLSRKPVSELIARICQDLGLAPDWPRLAQEAWAEEEIAGGAAGAPLLRLRGLDPPGAAPAAAEPQASELRAGSPGLNSG